MTHRHSLDDLHGETPVATIQIVMMRSGAVKVAGQITDEAFALAMLDTARDVVRGAHARKRLGHGDFVVVSPTNTALVGTPEEKALLASRDELANAMAGR